MKRTARSIFLFGLLASACGTEDSGDDASDGAGGAGGPGPAAGAESLFESACEATFTKSYDLVDAFGDKVTTVESGEKFLLGDYDSIGSGVNAAILVATDSGPIDFDLELDDGAASPFTSNCTVDGTEMVAGVFADTTLFKDAGLTEEACKFTRGESFPTSGFGYSLSNGDGAPEGVSVYEISFDEVPTRCGGLDSAFVKATDVEYGGTSYTVLPIAKFARPK